MKLEKIASNKWCSFENELLNLSTEHRQIHEQTDRHTNRHTDFIQTDRHRDLPILQVMCGALSRMSFLKFCTELILSHRQTDRNTNTQTKHIHWQIYRQTHRLTHTTGDVWGSFTNKFSEVFHGAHSIGWIFVQFFTSFLQTLFCQGTNIFICHVFLISVSSLSAYNIWWQSTSQVKGINATGQFAKYFYNYFSNFLLDQGPFCGATDYPHFWLCVTVPMGFNAWVVLLPVLLLASARWT